MDKLKAMVSKNLVNGLLNLSSFGCGGECEGCKYRKAHCLSFDKSLSRCHAPLECIHSDLMGPCATPFYSRSRYMLLFVNVFSKYTWVYFVKEKLEVFSKFLEFKETIEEVLNLNIKLVTDTGGEFIPQKFFSFYRKNGIERELTCVETPQQNDFTERKI